MQINPERYGNVTLSSGMKTPLVLIGPLYILPDFLRPTNAFFKGTVCCIHKRFLHMLKDHLRVMLRSQNTFVAELLAPRYD